MDTNLHSYAATVPQGPCRTGDCTIRSSGHSGQLIMIVPKCLITCLDVYESENGWHLCGGYGSGHLVGLDRMVNLWGGNGDLCGE